MKTRTLLFIFIVLFFSVLLFWEREFLFSFISKDPLARCMQQGLSQKQCLCLEEKLKEKITPQNILKLREDLQTRKDPTQEILEILRQLKIECVKKADP